jgi:hypothetical protein
MTLFALGGRDNVVQKLIPGFNTKCSSTINLTAFTQSFRLLGGGGGGGGGGGLLTTV